jgi:prepilin-type N-terminal cleavage/methylation domain-containing protein
MDPAIQKSRRRERGLTLTELLVVLAVLGSMTTGVVPSVRLILARAQGQDTSERLAASWQLAGALARAQQRPVLWRVAADETNCQVNILDADGGVLWSAGIDARNLRLKTTDSALGAPSLSFVMYPHGLTERVQVIWDLEGQTQHLLLGETVANGALLAGSK